MNSYFNSSFFEQNRATLRQNLQSDFPIILAANGLLQRTADSTYPFQQESNFWYLTGIDEPDCIVVIDRYEEYIILPAISQTKAIFDGAPDTAALTARSGITKLLSHTDGWRKLRVRLGSGDVYTTLPYPTREAHSGTYANPAQRRCVQSLRRNHPTLKLHDVSSVLADMRMVKQPAEIRAIEAAVTITCDTLADIRRANHIAALGYEYELEASITHGFRSRGASGHAYTPIVASGHHATTLHYIANTGKLLRDELIVVDVGAEVEHYAADITRTLAIKAPSARQQAVVDEVSQIQTYACSLLKPGLLLRDYERQVNAQMGLALQRLGLIANPKDMAGIRKYYPHATSHFLGLDVHDAGHYDKPLAEGVVLTCEPGIYIPEEGIGVRLEDDILITKNGNRNLSGNCLHAPYVL